MTKVQSSGIEPGQRRLNGPQTTGREYRNLSQPTHGMAHDDDVAVQMRDGVMLLADVHRPAEPGRYSVLIAASPYPRQIQNLGAPAGFIEAGASDFFVPRGYVHVIANCRGTSGSGGTFGFFDGQERRDMHDLVEWAAQQPWSDGNVGMIGISYFAADAVLGEDEEGAGSRTYMNLGGGLNRPRASETDPPTFLHWTTTPLTHDLDVIGPIELQLDAVCTAPDTAFIVVLQDVDEHGNVIDVTAGYLRAGLREVDEAASKQGAPALPCRTFEAVPIGGKVAYRIPLVPNARRFRAGHQLRLYLTTDDQSKETPAPLGFRHASVGTSSFNTVFSSSRLLLPVLPSDSQHGQ